MQRTAIPEAARKAGAPARRSAALVALEPDEPVETVAVTDLPVGCAPRPPLRVVHDPAAFAETARAR